VRTLSVLILAALGFLLVNALVRSLIPLPAKWLRSKVEFYEQHAEEYDVVFLGSSITLHGLIPEVFEQELAARGHEGIKVFNLGVGGMTNHETDEMLRRVLAVESERRRWIFYETPDWDPILYRRQIGDPPPRDVYWHSIGRTLAILRSLEMCQIERPDPPKWKTGLKRRYLRLLLHKTIASLGKGPEALSELAGLDETDWKLEMAHRHVRLCVLNLTGLGDGPRSFDAWFGLDAEDVRPTPEMVEELRGYLPILEEARHNPGVKGVQERLQADLAKYEREVQNVIHTNKVIVHSEGQYVLEALAEQIEAVREVGCEPIYYTGPRLSGHAGLFGLDRDGYLPTFFPYSRPDVYPELYAVENRFGGHHPNRSGSETWTRLMARDFASWLDTRGERQEK